MSANSVSSREAPQANLRNYVVCNLRDIERKLQSISGADPAKILTYALRPEVFSFGRGLGVVYLALDSAEVRKGTIKFCSLHKEQALVLVILFKRLQQIIGIL